MKINLYVRRLTVCVLALTTSLCSQNIQSHDQLPEFPKQQTDTYLQSPAVLASAVTLASLREFFDHTNFDKTRSVSVEKNQALFYSQAMTLFIQKVYNDNDYAKYLSQDGHHVTEFLSIANEFKLSCEQVYTGMRLFFNKYKEVQLIDDTVFNHILDALPHELEAYFPMHANAATKPQRSPAKMVENMLLSQLTDHIVSPKVGNDTFFHELSKQIAQSIEANPQQSDEAMMRERLRQLTIRFIEQLASKTMWYAEHPESVWQSVLSASHNVHLLCSNRVITHLDDRDDLFKSIVSRFVYFLEEYGAVLPLSFYEQVKYDINNHLVFFLEADELDEGVMSKKDILLQAITAAEAKAISTHKHGVIAS